MGHPLLVLLQAKIPRLATRTWGTRFRASDREQLILRLRSG